MSLDVRQMRLNFGLSLENWARRFNVSIETIIRWETEGVDPLDDATMKLLARRLNKKAQWVLSADRWLDFHDLQHRALAQVARAVRKGRIPSPKKLRCADCGSRATEYEHRDYNQPLKVDPVCASCNNQRGLAIYTLLNFPVGSRTT